MDASLELRWFFPRPPCPRETWFDDSHASPPRTDWYAFPCDVRSGVKLREGRLEIKLRLGDLGAFAAGPAQGRLERWTKSLAKLTEDEPALENRLAAAGWQAVVKRRWLRALVVSQESLQEIDPAARSRARCQFEWTEIEIASGPWWTLNLEAYGDEREQRNLLRLAGDRLLSRLPSPCPLQVEASCGYPEWLSRVF